MKFTLSIGNLAVIARVIVEVLVVVMNGFWMAIQGLQGVGEMQLRRHQTRIQLQRHGHTLHYRLVVLKHLAHEAEMKQNARSGAMVASRSEILLVQVAGLGSLFSHRVNIG